MDPWPGKFIIGLTGNIATGKSVVRKMLERLGAQGIDADALAHDVIAPDAPGYQPVIELFGKWILAKDGQIDRSRLAKIVFADAYALQQLESVIHPLVGVAIGERIRASSRPVIVIEAIKLIEAGLVRICDTVWVTYASEDVQLHRLQNFRSMSLEVAQQRISVQSPQEEKIAHADLVIDNSGSLEDTWIFVQEAWMKLVIAKDFSDS